MICPTCQIQMLEIHDDEHSGYACICCEWQCFTTKDGEVFAESYPMEDHIQAELDRIFKKPQSIIVKMAVIVLIAAFLCI